VGAAASAGVLSCVLATFAAVVVEVTVAFAAVDLVPDATGVDSGLATTVPAEVVVGCEAAGCGAVTDAVLPDEALVPGTGVAGCVAVEAAVPVPVAAVVGVVATVAETTFVVTLGDPAALVVGPVGAGAGLLGAVALATDGVAESLAGWSGLGAAAPALAGDACAVEVATLAAVPVLTVAGFLTAVALDGAVVVTTIVDAGGRVRLPPGCVFCTVTEFAGAAAAGIEAAFCAAGTSPPPGVPIPGKTVPCCRLPSFGCAAEGADEGGGALARVGVAGFVSGKLIGGNFGGTGIGGGAAVVVTSGRAGALRRNTPISGAEAAGTGPLRCAPDVSLPCTRRVMVLPSRLSV